MDIEKQSIVYQPLNHLKPNPHNARTHTKYQIRQISKSIQSFGFTNPLLVDPENQIIAGHGRVEAARLLGITEVPTIQLKQTVNRKYSELLGRASERAANWNNLSTEQREHFIKAILERIVVHPEEVEIQIRKNILIQKLLGNESVHSAAAKETHSLRCAYCHIPQGKTLRLVIGDTNDPLATNSLAILKAVSQARTWHQQLISGEAQGIKHLAKLNHLRIATVRKTMQFGFLSPASIEAILAGQVFPNLPFDSLVGRIPFAWDQQMALISPGRTAD